MLGHHKCEPRRSSRRDRPWRDVVSPAASLPMTGPLAYGCAPPSLVPLLIAGAFFLPHALGCPASEQPIRLPWRSTSTDKPDRHQVYLIARHSLHFFSVVGFIQTAALCTACRVVDYWLCSRYWNAQTQCARLQYSTEFKSKRRSVRIAATKHSMRTANANGIGNETASNELKTRRDNCHRNGRTLGAGVSKR